MIYNISAEIVKSCCPSCSKQDTASTSTLKRCFFLFKLQCYNKHATTTRKDSIFFMKKEQITLKEIKPKQNFIIIYDSVYKNTNLTTDEIALLIKLISSAPTFKPTCRKLADILHIDLKRFNKACKGLQDKGYLIVKRFGNKSEWNYTQEPFIDTLKDLSKETLLNALLNFEIDLKDLKQMHKLKMIDDKLFIDTANTYAKEIQRIIKTKWLDED